MPHIDPDCRGDKHRACPGWTWDDDTDREVPCECACHIEERRRMNHRITREGYIDTNPPADVDEALLTIEELCARFDRDERTIRRWLRRDHITRRFIHRPAPREGQSGPPARDVVAVRWGDILDASTRSTRWPMKDVS